MYDKNLKSSSASKIPLFPNFAPLSINHKIEIQNITRKYAPHSDFNFVSLFSYNTENDMVISNHQGNLVIKFRDYLTNEPFYSFIGDNNPDATISSLIARSVQEGLSPSLKLIPEDNISSMPELFSKFNISEDPDNFDYILSIPHLVELKGNEFHRHRTQINKLLKQFPDIQTSQLDLRDSATVNQILNLFDLWGQKKGKPQTDTIHELTAIQRTLAVHHQLDLLSFGLYHQGRLVSFLIADIWHEKYVETHFFKSDPEYDGAYTLLRRQIAQDLFHRGYEYMNIEQDLGIPGLRTAKQGWNPVKMLKRYRIAPKIS